MPSTVGRTHEPATSAAVPPIEAPTSSTRVAPSARRRATAAATSRSSRFDRPVPERPFPRKSIESAR
jgi:hypothetical protein